MGISGFFNSLNKKYEITKKINNENKISCKYLILDFNAIIHNISEYVIKHLQLLLKSYLIKINQGLEIKNNVLEELNIQAEFISFNPNNEDDIYLFFEKIFTTQFINKLIFQKIKDYIIYIINNCCHPDKLELIYICIDGVPSKAKIITQRKRGFTGKFISTQKKEIINKQKNKLNVNPDSFNNLPYNHFIFHSKKPTFNKNFIKPATDFMINLTKFLISKEFNKDIKSIGNFKIEVDSFKNNGEAEHKFIQYIFDNGLDNNVCVHSPDADLIVLLLNLKIKNLTIMRFNQQLSNLEESFDKFLIEEININKFKNHLFDLVNPDIKLDKSKLDNFIIDISMLYSFFGNDFISNIESVSVSNIEYIPDIYIQVFKKLNQNLIVKTTKFEINFDFLKEIFKILSDNEKKNLTANIISKKYKNVNDIKKKMITYSKFYLNKTLSDFDIIEFVEKYNNSRLIDLHKQGEKIDYLLNKNILNREYIDINDKDKDKLSDKELLKKANKDNNYLEESNLFSKYTNKKNGLIMIKKNLDTLNSWYHKNNIKDMDILEKEIYKLEKLLEEHLHFNYELKLTSNIEKYKDNFYKKFLKTDDINDVCKNYIEMLVWIVDTYLNREINLGQYYKYYKSPFCKDIYNYLNENKTIDNISSIGFTPSPLEHLLLVTPLDLNNLNKNIDLLLGDSYSEETKNNIVNVIKNKISDNLISDLFYKNGITLECFDARFIGACHVFNENELFDKYDEFISNFRNNLPLENQEEISQIGGALSMKYLMRITEFKNKYYDTRNIKYKEIYKSYKRKLNRLLI